MKNNKKMKFPVFPKTLYGSNDSMTIRDKKIDK